MEFSLVVNNQSNAASLVELRNKTDSVEGARDDNVDGKHHQSKSVGKISLFYVAAQK